MDKTIENDVLKITIHSKGAELATVYNKHTQLDYMWSGDASVWGKTSPVLFPIVGTLKADTYVFKNKEFKLSRHGFARDNEFIIESEEKTKIVFLLKDDSTSIEKYPFHFQLRLIYEVIGDSLYLTYDVTNTDKDVLYFSVGGHPAFKVPLVAGTQYEDYYLEFNKSEKTGRWPISKDGLIENHSEPLLDETNKLSLTRTLFQNDAIVLKNLKSGSIALKSTKHQHGLDFNVEGFPYLGLWAAKNGDFVCIEPWCGIADSVNHNQQLEQKEGIEKLGVGEKFLKKWGVKFY